MLWIIYFRNYHCGTCSMCGFLMQQKHSIRLITVIRRIWHLILRCKNRSTMSHHSACGFYTLNRKICDKGTYAEWIKKSGRKIRMLDPAVTLRLKFLKVEVKVSVLDCTHWMKCLGNKQLKIERKVLEWGCEITMKLFTAICIVFS